jgi:hypothetical protein
MASVSWIEYKGKRMLFMNFANSGQADVLKAVDLTIQTTKKEPPASILGLLDVTGSGFDVTVISGIKNMAEKDKPYMKMTAIVGVDGLKQVIFKSVLKFTGRKNLILKDTLDEAKDFLAEQP